MLRKMRRTLFYILLVLCGLLIFLLGRFLLSLGGFVQPRWTADLTAGTVAVFLCALLADRLGRSLHILIGGQETDYRQRLSELSRSLALIVHLDQLLDEEVGKLKEAVRADRVAIFLCQEEGGTFSMRARRGYEEEHGGTVSFEPEDRLLQWLDTNETMLRVREHPGVLSFLTDRERAMLERLHVDLVVPLTAMNRLVGMVFITKRRGFSKDDLELLTTFSLQGGLAFDNAMLYEQRRLRLRRMMRAERLAVTGQLAAGAAHEIRNPLTSIRSTIQYLRRAYKGKDEDAELMDELLGETDRINAIIEGLLSFARPAEPKLETIRLPELLESTVALVRTTARKAKVEIRYEACRGDSRIQGDPAQLRQVVTNIILNAIQATPEGGLLSILVSPFEEVVGVGRSRTRYWIEFRDTGVGIAPENLERIFDPFYTTKKEGTGLGLAISYGIIERHGGEIDVESEVERGTRVRIKL